MTTKSRGKNSKLGHDPLAWMEEQQSLDRGAESVHTNDDSTIKNSSVDHAEVAMNISEPESGAEILSLPDRFGIAQVSEMTDRMRQYLSRDVEVIEVHGENVEAIDTAAVQLLIGFFAEARNNGRKIVFSRYSTKIDEMADLLNLRQALSLE
jgi:ABC-type transporter Mla MlaB component